MKVYTQNDLILEYLLQGNSITPLIALQKFGCFRLSARIHNLREDYPIETKHVTKKNKTFASYSIQESYNPL